jgi:hypothetical protein
MIDSSGFLLGNSRLEIMMSTHRRQSHVRHSFLLVAIAALGLMLLTTTRAAAHHGWAGYLSEELELSGTLESPLSLGNPHATMKVRVDDQIWDVVLAPPARTASAGLKEGIIPVGANVTVQGHRHRNPKRLEIKTERVIWGERRFNVYPDRG